MRALVGMVADPLTKSINNPLSGTVTFGTTAPSCRTGYSYGRRN